MKYPEQLQTAEWAEKRNSIFRRDGFTCLACDQTGGELHCHHKQYNRNGFIWEVPDDWLETLCADCHEDRTAIERTIRDMPSDQFFRWWKDINNRQSAMEHEESEHDHYQENDDLNEYRIIQSKLLEKIEELKDSADTESYAENAQNPQCWEYWDARGAWA